MGRTCPDLLVKRPWRARPRQIERCPVRHQAGQSARGRVERPCRGTCCARAKV